ncbi:MAG: glycosyltransferase family 2 protein [Bacteroidetes bacterium]|nr:glycosyltransferase family 2 protein [Bacteroidota bacterium]
MEEKNLSSKKMSFVVPVYYEEECILQFIKEIEDEMRQIKMDFEFVFVDDGSTDKTVQLIKQEASAKEHIKLIEFSYNHGKQAAVSAGIKYASGDYLMYMDPDLQDPPKEIINFLTEIEKGYDLVFGVREEKKDSFTNVILSKIFWSTLERFTGLKIPKGLAVMRLFNRKFADRFLVYGEQNRFIEGVFMHIGLNRSVIKISQRARFAGKSKFNFKRKMALAFDAIFDFSEKPLKAAVKIGVLLSVFGFILLIALTFIKLFVMDFKIGWLSTIGTIILCSGIQLFFMGIMAIYIGRIYKETKGRPLYSIKELTNINE